MTRQQFRLFGRVLRLVRRYHENDHRERALIVQLIARAELKLDAIGGPNLRALHLLRAV